MLETVYGAYAVDWQIAPEGAPIESLSAEALHLALIVSESLPGEPEALGLAALLCFSEARCPARRDAGRFVPLDEQDAARRDRALIGRGEKLLTRAHRFGRPGRFQYEAAIQSAHSRRAFGAPVDPVVVRRLYRALVLIAPTLGARVALAALDGEIDGPLAGLRSLDELDADRLQAAWMVRAHLLMRLGRTDEAATAYRAARLRTSDATVVDYVDQRLRDVDG